MSGLTRIESLSDKPMTCVRRQRKRGRFRAPYALVLAAAPSAPSVALAENATAPPLNDAPQLARPGLFGHAGLNWSAFSRSRREGVRVSRALGFDSVVGYRAGRYALFGVVEPNFWRSPRLGGGEEVVMALNVGVGAEVLSVDGFVRTSLASGPSVLLLPTEIDEVGDVGFFFELRPLGLRWALAENLLLGCDPLSLSIVVPVLHGIPLVEIQYRTSFYLETSF